MCRINQDPTVMEFFPNLQDAAQTQAFIERNQKMYTQQGFMFYPVEQKATGAFLCFVGLSVADFDAHFTPATEIGWRLGAEYWGQGYATEAAKAVLKDAFERLALQEIVSFTAVDNVRSRAVMSRLGMTCDECDHFYHPKLEPSHPLALHALYRINSTF